MISNTRGTCARPGTSIAGIADGETQSLHRCGVSNQLAVTQDQLAAAAAISTPPPESKSSPERLSVTITSAEAALGALGDACKQAAAILASAAFPKFVQSKGCLPLIEQLLGASKQTDLRAAGLLHDPEESYDGPVLAWLHTVSTDAAAQDAQI